MKYGNPPNPDRTKVQSFIFWKENLRYSGLSLQDQYNLALERLKK